MKNIKKQRISALDFYIDDIKKYVEMGLSLTSVQKLINPKLPQNMSWTAYDNFCKKRGITKPVEGSELS